MIGQPQRPQHRGSRRRWRSRSPTNSQVFLRSNEIAVKEKMHLWAFTCDHNSTERQSGSKEEKIDSSHQETPKFKVSGLFWFFFPPVFFFFPSFFSPPLFHFSHGVSLQWPESLLWPPSPMEVTCRGLLKGGCLPQGARSPLGRRQWCWRRKSLCWGASPSSLAPSLDLESSSLPRACSRTRAVWACLWLSGPPVGSCHCLVSAATSQGVCLWAGQFSRWESKGWCLSSEWNSQGYPPNFPISVWICGLCKRSVHYWQEPEFLLVYSCRLFSLFLRQAVSWLFPGATKEKADFDDPVKSMRAFCPGRLCLAVCLGRPSSWHAEWNTCEVKAAVAYLDPELSVQHKFYWLFFFFFLAKQMGGSLFFLNVFTSCACQFLGFFQKSLMWKDVWWHTTQSLSGVDVWPGSEHTTDIFFNLSSLTYTF